MHVIGAGFGRTGTASLKNALERLLGGPCYHMTTLISRPDHVQAWADFAAGRRPMNWHQLLAGHVAAVDFPVCIYYRQLLEVFPEARVVLTLRDPNKWWNSFSRLLTTVNRVRWMRHLSPRLRLLVEFADIIITRNTFDSRLEREHCIHIFERHNAAVRALVPAERLLAFDIADGWEPLCAFLQLPVPAEPFPHEHAGRIPLRQTLRRMLLRA